MAQPSELWFDFASTYSYLSGMRLEEAAQAQNVETVWRPFLLGPIFGAQGWTTSPFNIYPNKGRYMLRDMERRTAAYGLPYTPLTAARAGVFPQNGMLAARIALIGLDADWGRAFTKAVYTAQFVDHADIAAPAALDALATQVGAPPDILARATEQANKDRLRAQTERAMALGIFGAPSFTIGGELFWGDDRLEDALAWASRVTT